MPINPYVTVEYDRYILMVCLGPRVKQMDGFREESLLHSAIQSVLKLGSTFFRFPVSLVDWTDSTCSHPSLSHLDFLSYRIQMRSAFPSIHAANAVTLSWHLVTFEHRRLRVRLASHSRIENLCVFSWPRKGPCESEFVRKTLISDELENRMTHMKGQTLQFFYHLSIALAFHFYCLSLMNSISSTASSLEVIFVD